MEPLSLEQIFAEMKRYYDGDPKARPPQHLYRMVREEDIPKALGSDNWAVARKRQER